MAFHFALPRGERRLPLGAYNNILRFQFALPRGERLEVAVLDVIDAVVSIRAPRGERRNTALAVISAARFQFALPRGERHSA